MSLALPLEAAASGEHDGCVRFPVAGWRVCLTSWPVGVAVAVTATDRVRVVVCEPGGRGHNTGMAGQVGLAAGRLLATGFDVVESVDPLRVLLARRCGRHWPGPALILLDLLVSGDVEVARHNAPPARQISEAGHGRLVPDRGDGTTQVLDGGWVFGFSPSFAGLIVAGPLAQASSVSDPCRLRERLVDQGASGVARRLKQAPPLAVAVRTVRSQATTYRAG